jgi:hypothetical protein
MPKSHKPCPREVEARLIEMVRSGRSPTELPLPDARIRDENCSHHGHLGLSPFWQVATQSFG